MLIIVGTSLRGPGIKRIVCEFAIVVLYFSFHDYDNDSLYNHQQVMMTRWRISFLKSMCNII